MIADKAARMRELFLPWSGLLGGGAGWFLTQQAGSDQSFDNCQGTSPLVILLIGIAGLALTGGGALLALRIWYERGASHGARRFIAGAGVGMAALFAIAILLQSSGRLLIPRCFG